MPFIRNLIWNPANTTHIARHQVTTREVEQVVRSEYMERPTYLGRAMLIGSTEAGRMLVVVLGYVQDDDYFVVTARPASRRERRLYQQQKGGGGHA